MKTCFFMKLGCLATAEIELQPNMFDMHSEPCYDVGVNECSSVTAVQSLSTLLCDLYCSLSKEI